MDMISTNPRDRRDGICKRVSCRLSEPSHRENKITKKDMKYEFSPKAVRSVITAHYVVKNNGTVSFSADRNDEFAGTLALNGNSIRIETIPGFRAIGVWAVIEIPGSTSPPENDEDSGRYCCHATNGEM